MMLAAFAGLVSTIFSELSGGRVVAAMALPLALLVLFVFVLSNDLLIVIIFLIRAGADMLLNFTRVAGGAGLGFVFNVLIVASVLRSLMAGDVRIHRALKQWLPFLVCASLGVAVAPDRWGALKIFIGFATFVAAYCVGARATLEGEREKYIKIFLIAAAMPFLWSVAMAALGTGYVVEIDGGRRFAGAFGHPNILAFFCVFNCALVLFSKQIRLTSSGVGNALLLAHMLLSLGLLLLTRTRSAWAGALAIFIGYAIFYERKYFVYIFLSIFAALMVPEVRDRVFGIFEPKVYSYAVTSNSYEWRLQLWESALRSLSLREWVFGKGLGAFVANSAEFFDLAGGISFGAHSIYVQTIYESGLVGLLVFLVTMGSIFAGFFAMSRRYGARNEARFGSVMLLAYLMFGYADNMFNYTAFNYYIFAAFGMFSVPVAGVATGLVGGARCAK